MQTEKKYKPDAKIIALNTLFLYIRNAIILVLGLLTSRYLLDALGISNFGIYTAVSGVMMIFIYLCGTLETSVQRFISYAIGKDKASEIQSVFSASLLIHFILAGLVILLGETIGLWFVANKMVFPEGMHLTAIHVYQVVLFSAICNIIFMPFSAALISYEKFNIYAIVNIFAAILKLIIVVLLFAFDNTNRLVAYAYLFLFVNLIQFFILYLYAKFNLKNIQFSKTFLDKKLFKEIFSFSGWSLFGRVSDLGNTECINIILNIFCGTIANASIGISTQINASIYNFINNFQIAFNPQLVKSYSSRNLDFFKKLIFNASKLSYVLGFVFILPCIINLDYILSIWLVEVPQYASIFAKLVLTYSLTSSITTPIWTSIYATGNIKKYQIYSFLWYATIPFIAYLLLYYDFPVYYVFVARVIMNIIISTWRIIYSKSLINISPIAYFKKVVFPILLLTIFILITILPLSSVLVNPLIKLLITTPVSILLTLLFAYILLLDNQDRIAVTSKAKTIFAKILKRNLTGKV